MMQNKPVNKDSQIHELLNKVYDEFQKGDFVEAQIFLDEAHQIDFENVYVISALKCASFWLDRIEQLEHISNELEQGDYLRREWELFNERIVQKIDCDFEKGLFAVRHFVFSRALKSYSVLLEEHGNDADILINIGRCHKGRGDFDSAVEAYELALKQNRENSEVLSELADCYALVNEIKIAKVFFREAFFINPQKITLKNLESSMIRRLIEKLRESGFTAEEIKEWIPVYGVLYGIFNIRREMRGIEVNKLKQSIVSLKNNLREKDTELLVPRLINKYFWLIDYYISKNEKREKIEELLVNIKQLDFNIYQQYIN